MQDTILKYYYLKNKDEIIKINKWIKSICIRKSIDDLRSKKRLEINLDNYKNDTNMLPQEIEFSQDFNKSIIIEIIKNSLSKLPDKYRLIVSLYLFEGYDYKEIEQITGAKEGTLRTIYSRGLSKLNQMVKEELKCKI